jgi:hypothetical protein
MEITPNKGLETDGQASLPAEVDIRLTHSDDASLAGALLELVRDTEAGLDIKANRLACDAHTLPRDDQDRLAEITTEAAYVAGQRDTLGRVIEVIANAFQNQVEKPEKEE